MHNGLIDETKCQSSEQKGNLIYLLCIVHKTKARNVLQTALQLSDQRWSKFLHFIKMYLAMEEWFHDCNDNDEVNVSRGEISKVLSA